MLALATFASGGGPVNSYSGSDNPNWEYADSFTTVHGKHTFGLGLDYRRWHLIRNLDDDFYGDWGFSPNTAQKNFLTCTNPAVSPQRWPAALRHRQRHR